MVTYYINRERENPKLLQIIINYGVSVLWLAAMVKKINNINTENYNKRQNGCKILIYNRNVLVGFIEWKIYIYYLIVIIIVLNA